MASELFNRRDVLAYFIVAAIGASLQLVAGSILQDWFQLTYEEALFVGYVIAFVVGFVLTKLFAFNAKNSAQTNREAIKFTLVSILSCLITVYGSVWLYNYSVSLGEPITVVVPFSVKEVNVNKLASQIAGMGASFLNNYVLHKQFTFRHTGFYEKLKKMLNL
ncbi:GtrA family protein [Spirosoma rigui]|uniref:GtrA family protein n=1 Tax=Spirosoma rigui TaxID=564064 RepID=UPI0009AF3431|nr:GtrA family protein [Spirosoma rigui]